MSIRFEAFMESDLDSNEESDSQEKSQRWALTSDAKLQSHILCRVCIRFCIQYKHENK